MKRFIAQISWQPDYDSFFYRQLSRRALRIYLFRSEYIFELEKAVVVETPQSGNATYLFAKRESMDGFLAAYAKISKDDIRCNRENIGEKLGFLAGSFTPTTRTWLRGVESANRGNPDFVAAATMAQ